LNSCPICGTKLENSEIGGRERLICGSSSCEFVNWDNPKPVTATLVPHGEGLVLVLRKFEPYTGYWCLPGGFIENCEDPSESAAREVLEETGLTIQDHQLIGAVAPGREINVVILFYEAPSSSGTMEAGDDASDVRSFKHDELPPNIAFELHRKAIRKWFETHHGKSPVLHPIV
jgi:8-oxo-dGTP diphosphatase